MRVFLRVVFIFFILISCETEVLQSDTVSESSTDINAVSLSAQGGISDLCVEISGNGNPIGFNGEQRTYVASSDESFSIQWEAGANTQIIGSSTSPTVTIGFLNRNADANFRAIVDGGRCVEIINISKFQSTCPLGTPTVSAIFAKFSINTAPGYVEGNLGSNPICVNSIANELSVEFSDCYTYEWSITPSGPNKGTLRSISGGNKVLVQTASTGAYTVRLRTINNSDGSRKIDTYLLDAVECNGFGGGF